MPEPKVHAPCPRYNATGLCGVTSPHDGVRFATSRSQVTCRRCIQSDPGPFAAFHKPKEEA